LCEGQVWEAAMAASHYRLDNLVAIVDRNQLCADGPTEDVLAVEPIDGRFAAFGWETRHVDGHSLAALVDLFDHLPRAGGRPQLIVAETIKGRGVKRMERSALWHMGSLVGDDYHSVIAELQQGLQPPEGS
jgi:transketolase